MRGYFTTISLLSLMFQRLFRVLFAKSAGQPFYRPIDFSSQLCYYLQHCFRQKSSTAAISRTVAVRRVLARRIIDKA